MTVGIHTVSGVIPSSTVGRVLPHEHVFCDFSRVTGQLNHVLNDRALAVEELAALRGTGVGCVVDATTEDLGRDPLGLLRVSEDTGLAVVMGTGWYREPYYPSSIDRLSVDAIADGMIAELQDGVCTSAGTAYAGIIGEVGVDREYMSAQEERVFRAAARASLGTGAPITTHTGIYPTGLVQIDVLVEEGVDPSKIVIGHADMFLDLDYHYAVLQRGAYLQFDTTGRAHLNPDHRRADFIVDLLGAGWGERLLVSSDRCFRSDLLAFGGVGYAHTVTTFFDLLRERGVGETELDLLSQENPARMLSW